MRYPGGIPEKEKMEIFMNNLKMEMNYRLQLQCPLTFEKIIKNGLVKKGKIKLFKENKGFPNTNNNFNNNNRGANNSNDK